MASGIVHPGSPIPDPEFAALELVERALSLAKSEGEPAVHGNADSLIDRATGKIPAFASLAPDAQCNIRAHAVLLLPGHARVWGLWREESAR